MSEIYFFRHGQASFGAQNYDQLSQIGIRQSEIIANFLETHDIRFNAIYSGRMSRQKDTAKPLCDRYAIRRPQCREPGVMAAFDEYEAKALFAARTRIDNTEPEDMAAKLRESKGDFQAYFAETVYRWTSGDFDGEPGVESWKGFCRRVSEGIQQIMAQHGRGKRLAVFTSGGPISIAVKSALGLSDRTTIEISWQIMNASLTCLKYNHNGLALWVFNNTAHLLIEKDPSLLTYR